jgi:putative endonuclease
MFSVYVLQSADGEFYIGYSADLRARLQSHNSGSNRSTRGRAWNIVYYEAYATESAARDRERILKHDGRSRRALMDRLVKHLK